MAIYADLVKENGFLLLSGFYTEDIEDLTGHAKPLGLELISQQSKDNWAALIMKKVN